MVPSLGAVNVVVLEFAFVVEPVTADVHAFAVAIVFDVGTVSDSVAEHILTVTVVKESCFETVTVAWAVLGVGTATAVAPVSGVVADVVELAQVGSHTETALAGVFDAWMIVKIFETEIIPWGFVNAVPEPVHQRSCRIRKYKGYYLVTIIESICSSNDEIFIGLMRATSTTTFQ